MCDADYINAFKERGLTSIDAVFSFSGGVMLTKTELAKHRQRIQVKLNSPETVIFLKRYNKPPISAQLKNWLCYGDRVSMASCDYEPAKMLSAANINVPKIIACGQEWGILFEKRSFVISEKIPNAASLEKSCRRFLTHQQQLKM